MGGKETKMKIVMIGLVIIATLFCALMIFDTYNHRRANAELRDQVQVAWKQVNMVYALCPKRCSNRQQITEHADNQWKALKIISLKVDPSLRQETNEFVTTVLDPAIDFFDTLSDSNGLGRLNPYSHVQLVSSKAKTLEQKLNAYQRDHQELSRPEAIADSLTVNLQKAYATQEPARPVEAVYFPDWVQTPQQRSAWKTMVDVAREYLAARARLSRAINWNYGRSNWAYFGEPQIQTMLSNAINTRRQLKREVNQAMQIEGMSNLGAMLSEMIDNSIYSLQALIDNQDYGTFKAYNNRNDAISAEIKRRYQISVR